MISILAPLGSASGTGSEQGTRYAVVVPWEPRSTMLSPCLVVRPLQSQIVKTYVLPVTIKNTTASPRGKERFTPMGKCKHTPGMPCFVSSCPFDDSHFLEQVEAYLKDFPLRMNEVRLLHRCDIALSLVGVENLAASFFYSGKVTRRRCEGMQVAHDRWERRRRANSIEIAIMMGETTHFPQNAAVSM